MRSARTPKEPSKTNPATREFPKKCKKKEKNNNSKTPKYPETRQLPKSSKEKQPCLCSPKARRQPGRWTDDAELRGVASLAIRLMDGLEGRRRGRGVWLAASWVLKARLF